MENFNPYRYRIIKGSFLDRFVMKSYMETTYRVLRLSVKEKQYSGVKE
jgi:hypothetical protein